MFSPDCGLFTKWKSDQWKFIQEELLPVLSQAAVDAKQEEFSWHHVVLQAQLDEAQRAPQQENDDEEQGQDPEPAGGVIPDSAGADNDNDGNS